MVVVFGLSFELPLLLVMLNITGVLTGKRMLGWWRGMIMGITVFAAVATPSTDPLTMLALAGADLAAVLRGRRLLACSTTAAGPVARPSGPDDDEASELDLTPEDIGEIEPCRPPAALPGAGGRRADDRVNGYDDVT